MSIFVEDCAVQATQSICAHSKRFYPEIAGEPPIYYIIDETQGLPGTSSIRMSRSGSGDDCHGEIVGAKNSELEAAYKPKNWGDYIICAEGGPRPLTQADIDQIVARQQAAPAT